MKKTIIKSLMISILLQTQFLPYVHASQAMEQAEKIIQSHRELAKDKALLAVNEDFNFALSEMLKSVLKRPDVAEVKKSLFSEQEFIMKGLNNLIELKDEDSDKLKEQVYAAMEQYKKMVQTRFDISFKPSEVKKEMRESLIVANQVLADFEKNCSSGKGIGGLNNPQFNYPALPRSDFSISIGYGNEKGPQFSSSGTFSGSQDEKNRNEVANVALGVSSVVTSIAYSGTTAASVAACQAAAPFMLAGGAVIAIGVMYMNQMERIKMQNEIVEAELHAFHESADDRDIAKYYQASCKRISADSNKLRNLLDSAINNPDELLKHFQNSSNWEQDLKAITELINKREELYQQTLALLDKNKTSPSAELQKNLEANITALKDLDSEIKKDFTPEKVSDLMISFIVKQDQDFRNNMDMAIWKSIDLLQRKAFEKVLNLVLRLQKKNFKKFLDLEDDFGLEGQAATSLLNAKMKFKEVLNLQIKGIFGRAKASDILAAEQDLKKRTKNLLQLYILNSEVADFGRTVKSLLGDL